MAKFTDSYCDSVVTNDASYAVVTNVFPLVYFENDSGVPAAILDSPKIWNNFHQHSLNPKDIPIDNNVTTSINDFVLHSRVKKHKILFLVNRTILPMDCILKFKEQSDYVSCKLPDMKDNVVNDLNFPYGVQICKNSKNSIFTYMHNTVEFLIDLHVVFPTRYIFIGESNSSIWDKLDNPMEEYNMLISGSTNRFRNDSVTILKY